MTLELGLIGLSGAAAVVYAILLGLRAPARFRTAARSIAMVGLAAVAVWDQGPMSLTWGLTLGAVAAAYPVGAARRWPPADLTVLFTSNLAFFWLFSRYGGGWAALAAESWRAVGVFGAPAIGAMLLASAWPMTDTRRRFIGVWTATASIMAAAAFTLPRELWPAMPGAALLLISSVRIFIRSPSPPSDGRSADLAWTIGFAGQALIAFAFLR